MIAQSSKTHGGQFRNRACPHTPRNHPTPKEIPRHRPPGIPYSQYSTRKSGACAGERSRGWEAWREGPPPQGGPSLQGLLPPRASPTSQQGPGGRRTQLPVRTDRTRRSRRQRQQCSRAESWNSPPYVQQCSGAAAGLPRGRACPQSVRQPSNPKGNSPARAPGHSAFAIPYAKLGACGGERSRGWEAWREGPPPQGGPSLQGLPSSKSSPSSGTLCAAPEPQHQRGCGNGGNPPEFFHLFLLSVFRQGNPDICNQGRSELPQRFSFFRASIGLSRFSLRMAYSMVTNTTANTLSTAMPMAAQGRRKAVSNPESTTR